jgi:hypothetical protein
MENAIGFIVFVAVATFAFRKQLTPLYNKYFGDKK